MIDFEQENGHNLQPVARMKVIGIGGGGGNTVNSMIDACYENVEFIVANTDAQALKTSKAPFKIQIGQKSTKGLGAGANPEIGKKAAEEDLSKIMEYAHGADVVFLTSGLGGGTGSGALPVIAHALKEKGILTIAVVTKPFEFEGKRRMVIAQQAIEQLKKEVDTLIVIPNQKLLALADAKLSLINAFNMVNGIMNQVVRSIYDIVSRPGHVNVDFADVKAIMQNKGYALMGTGKASGQDRAIEAALEAVSSPLLENISIQGARGVLINITGNSQLGLHEVSAAASLIYEQADEDANIIVGSVIDDQMGDMINITIIATGFMECVEKATLKESIPQQMVHVAPAQQCTEPLPVSSVQEPASSLKKEDIVKETVTTQAHESKEFLAKAQELIDKASSIDQADLEIPTLLRRMVNEKQFQKK